MEALDAALSEVGLTGVLIGGVAVSIIGAPRFTADIDAMVVYDASQADRLAAALERHGFKPLFAGMVEAARETHVVAVKHRVTGIKVDIALACMPFEEEVVARSTPYRERGGALRAPSPEDLIILKAIANRPKDREDIKTIASTHPDLDVARIRRWVEQYGDLMDEPGLWRDVERLLTQPD